MKTKEIVLGAMMVAMIGAFNFIDRMTGNMFSVLIYYLSPLPYCAYGLNHGFKKMLLVMFSSVIVTFLVGSIESIFFQMSAMLIAMAMLYLMQRNADSFQLYLGISLFTTLSQLGMCTIFSGLLGYNVLEDFQMFKDMIPMRMDLLIIFVSCLIGLMEGFIIESLAMLLFKRLKLKEIKMTPLCFITFPRLVGVIFGLSFIGTQISGNDVLLMIYLFSFILVLIQGVSYALLLNLKKGYLWKRNLLIIVLAFIPGINFIYIVLGLIDLFSEKRKKILYTIGTRG